MSEVPPNVIITNLHKVFLEKRRNNQLRPMDIDFIYHTISELLEKPDIYKKVQDNYTQKHHESNEYFKLKINSTKETYINASSIRDQEIKIQLMIGTIEGLFDLFRFMFDKKGGKSKKMKRTRTLRSKSKKTKRRRTRRH